jgi:hypothetical protein
MKKFFTHFCFLVLGLAFFQLNADAQCDPPSLVFRNPQLVNGVDGQVNATYKFSNVTPGADAYIRIDSLVGGASLLNIDVIDFGYQDAWQPQVGGPGMPLGNVSYIRWEISFKAVGTTDPYYFNCFSLSAVDIDGDNVKEQEFTEAFNVSNYSYLLPSVLTVSQSSNSVMALGSVDNKKDIDTLADDTRVRFDYSGVSKITLKTGSVVNPFPRPGTASTDRYNCVYFKSISSNRLTLPVKFIDFRAGLRDNQKVQLNWLTDEEVNNKQFEVERSEDAKSFKTVGVIFPDENVHGQHNYRFADNANSVKTAVVFYRIRQVDKDGNYMYSKTISIKLEAPSVQAAVTMKIGPNPVSNEFTISADNNASLRAIRVVNMSGAEVFSRALNEQTGTLRMSTQNINMKSAGLYIVEVTLADGSKSVQKIIKQ